jgi:hypothetical protein
VGNIDNLTWYVLGLILTGGGVFWSYLRYHKHGLAVGVRSLAWALLPLALALTGTLKLAGEIVDDIGRWGTHLVFSPVVWLGICLAGVSVVLYGASGLLRGRGIGGPQDSEGKPLTAKPSKKPAKAPVDDDMADIEAILRKHGIQ